MMRCKERNFDCIIQGGYFNRGLILSIQKQFQMDAKWARLNVLRTQDNNFYAWLKKEVHTIVFIMYKYINPIRFFLFVPPSRYNWNIIESGVKHHKSNPLLFVQNVVRFVLFTIHIAFPHYYSFFLQYHASTKP